MNSKPNPRRKVALPVTDVPASLVSRRHPRKLKKKLKKLRKNGRVIHSEYGISSNLLIGVLAGSSLPMDPGESRPKRESVPVSKEIPACD